MTIESMKKEALTLRKARSPMAATMVFHLSEIENIGKNAGNRETTDDEAVQYLKKTIAALASPEEIAMLKPFLPAMASDEEIKAVLDPAKPIGANMGAAKKAFGVNVDMNRVRQLYEEMTK